MIRFKSSHLVLGSLCLLAGCSGTAPEPDPIQENRCSVPQGEFGWHQCAIVEGIARDAQGVALIQRTIRVDSFIPNRGFQYTSQNETTTAEGRFRLEVIRVARLSLHSPDTATIDLRLFNIPNPQALADPVAVVPVEMSFADVGKLVELTTVDVRFQPVP